MSATWAYTARVWSLSGVLTTHLVSGSTAGCALTTLRRSRRGDWTRIEVGTGENENFRPLQEVSR